jgi:allophanate hydrolase subunit 1
MESKYVLIRCADDLLSLSVDGPEDAQALAAHLRESGAWLDVVAGIDSVVVHFDAAALNADKAEHQIVESLAGGISPLGESEDLLEIPVVYGGEYGPDLDELCRELGMSTTAKRAAAEGASTMCRGRIYRHRRRTYRHVRACEPRWLDSGRQDTPQTF